MTNDTEKFCVNCRFHDAALSAFTVENVHVCAAGDDRDVVTGIKSVKKCSTNRMPGMPCGPHGTLYEERPPQRWAAPGPWPHPSQRGPMGRIFDFIFGDPRK